MNINWVRLLITIVATFMAYGLVYESLMAIIGLGDLRTEYMRPPEDPLTMWMWTGHIIETIVIVIIFHVFVKTKDLKLGSFYGLMFGLYFAATQISTLGAVTSMPAEIVFDFVPLHLLAGLIAAGIVPTLLYAPANTVPSDHANEA